MPCWKLTTLQFNALLLLLLHFTKQTKTLNTLSIQQQKQQIFNLIKINQVSSVRTQFIITLNRMNNNKIKIIFILSFRSWQATTRIVVLTISICLGCAYDHINLFYSLIRIAFGSQTLLTSINKTVRL